MKVIQKFCLDFLSATDSTIYDGRSGWLV